MKTGIRGTSEAAPPGEVFPGGALLWLFGQAARCLQRAGNGKAGAGAKGLLHTDK